MTKLSGQRIADLFTCAIEGGSGYWCGSAKLVSHSNPVIDANWYADIALFEGEFVIEVEDAVDGDKTQFGHAEVARAAGIMKTKYPHHWHNVVIDNEDAETGDVFLQVSAFGEIVYG